MQCPLVMSYPADMHCPGPLPSSDLFNHICDLFVFFYPDVCFSVLVCYLFNILLYIFVCAAATLFFC